MATDKDFETLKNSGDVKDFRDKNSRHRITGQVVDRGKSIVAGPDGQPVKPWAVEDSGGNTHEIVAAEFDILD